MIADNESITFGMVALAIISIVVLFGSAWWAVNALNKGNRRFSWRQFRRRRDHVAGKDDGARQARRPR